MALATSSRRILKDAWRHASLPWRRATSRFRPFPNALVIGTAKGGTTTLHSLLRQHPEVATGVTQETHYFDGHYHRGTAWYRSQFPLGSARCVVDVTPAYMFKSECFPRILADLPGAKIIALLRDPVTRAYSHYRHAVRGMGRTGVERRTFPDAVRADIELIRAGHALGRAGTTDAHHSYVRRGLYARQLAPFVEAYGKGLLVVRSEDLFHDPRSVATTVFRFLEIDPAYLPDTSARNQAPPVADVPLRLELRTFFRPFNEELYALLGIEPWWPYPDS